MTVSSLARTFLLWLTAHLRSPRVIYDRLGVSPYLSRWYLLGGPRTDGEAFDEQGGPLPGVAFSKFPLNIYIHRFHRGDDDVALHNHPWRWSIAIVLAGGYAEERREGGAVRRRIVRPLALNVIRGDDFHRVELLEHDAWSLFIAGPKASSWGFWERDTGAFTPWRDFIAKRRGSA